MQRIVFYIIVSLITLTSFCQCKEDADTMIAGHKYVDLGLSVVWAECNVGADKPYKCGDWFAWGETKVKENDDWQTYLEELGGNIETYKDCGTEKDPLREFIAPNARSIASTEYDAATFHWGECWRTPTKEDFEELLEKCTFVWEEQNGQKGAKITGPNGNSIFLPAGSEKDFSSMGYDWPYCYYWSATPNEIYPNYAWYFYFNYKHNQNLNYYNRYTGLLIRPVAARP